MYVLYVLGYMYWVICIGLYVCYIYIYVLTREMYTS